MPAVGVLLMHRWRLHLLLKVEHGAVVFENGIDLSEAFGLYSELKDRCMAIILNQLYSFESSCNSNS